MFESNPYARPAVPTPRTHTSRWPWLVFGLWVVCCLILQHTYGHTPTWFWSSWASLVAILAGVWVGRRINRRRAGLLVVPVLVAAMIGASPAPPASATTYPSGCAQVWRTVAIQRVGFTIGNIVTDMRLCQGSGGNPTASTFVSARVDTTSWGVSFGYTFGIDRIAADPYWAGHRGFKITGWARGCITQLGIPLCYPTQTWQVYEYAVGGIASPTTSPWPEQTGSAMCTNGWCSYTGLWNMIPLYGLVFSPITWFSAPIHVS